MQLHRDNALFKSRNTTIVTIGPEGADRFLEYFSKNGFDFYGLPDKNQTVLKLYGQEVNLFKMGRMPAQMLIDRNGMLRYVHYGHSMQDIPDNEELFALIDTL